MRDSPRKILFDKKANKLNDQPRPEQPTLKIQKSNSEKIIEWLDSHPGFKPRYLCETLNIDDGNFHRYINTDKKIPDKYISAITLILKKYGYE